MTTTKTLDELKNDYKNSLQASNSSINAQAPNSAWSILAGATAAVLLDLYYNLQLIENSVYPQNAVADQVDLWLYRQGLPARGGQTYAYIFANVTSTTPVIIPANTIFNDAVTGNTYQTLEQFVIPNGSYEITLYSTKAGSNYLEPTGSTLTSNSITIAVTNSINGQEEESDQSCINRILTSLRAPIAGSRQTDYQVYALDYNSTITTPIVTNSITIPKFLLLNNVGILGLFIMGGTPITENQLNKGLLSVIPSAGAYVEFTRQLDDPTVVSVNDYIQSLRLVGLSIKVGTIITHTVATDSIPLAVTVSLASGFALSTILTIPSQDSSNNPISIEISVEDLIKREIRRAITTQQFGGTNIANQNYITLDSIYYSINLQLSYLNGTLAQILTNISIAGGDISVPNYNFNINNVYYIYDIESYDSLTIGTA